MDNVTFPQYLYFTIFGKGNENVKALYFLITILAYVLIIFLNVSILMAVLMDRSLHEQPMYLLMCCLLFNSLYGSSALLPRLSADLLSNTHAISRTACSTQIFVICTYAICEYNILTVMAYDRYVAICDPLRYHDIMTQRKILLLIFCAVSYAVFFIVIGVYLSGRLPLCGNKIPGLYCSNWSMVRLSCVSTVINNIFGFFLTVTTVFLPPGFILFTYIRILIVCRKSTAEFRGKALQTCLPHIVGFVMFSIALFSDIALSRYEPGQISTVVVLIFSLEYIVIPPLLNPLLYGLNLPDIRRRMLSVMISLKGCHRISSK
ncbi:putative gustatory receptor clone PTE03 [Engraulis encrasicolus]|uniref:putative gustatory receptor clone PTE03 n=1 Tax=Engraulis encrasicolus TaxID=184585 RepID=UPI002FD0FE3F